MMRVADIIGSCDTGLARGLSLQLIDKLNHMVKMPLLVKVQSNWINTSSNAVNAYLQPSAAAKLLEAAKSCRKIIKIISCLRTTVQQHIIRRQFEKGLCGITAAALPGRSNHERGAAIDIEDPEFWQERVEAYGWSKLGSWDNMHYDFHDCNVNVSSLQISAFQMLWNQNNPRDLIVVDGAYGRVTAAKIDLSPVDGW
jgi:N-acetylmuramoyl-L-alanine amidase